MKKFLAITIAIAVCSSFIFGYGSFEDKICGENDIEEVTSANKRSGAVEFQYSKEESKAIEKWKKKTSTEMLSDAMNGDPAGLYTVGMSFYYGLAGFPINIEMANRCCAASALLGFAPAMDQIRLMYIETDKNPFLALVYANLATSFGHNEFTMAYHDIRKTWVEMGEQEMFTEIERIATKKKMAIYKTINELEKSKDKVKKVKSILFVEHGIIGEDADFDWDYWEKFLNKEVES